MLRLVLVKYFKLKVFKISIDDFYKTRKDRGNVPSAYAYECKRCSIKRVSESRKRRELVDTYPDW